ncbi:MAG: hypothetical protein ACOY45_06090 [Pseudomonadota bacterium]
MSRGPDAATLLERALVRMAARAGCPIDLVRADWDRWASATFTGARHHLTVRGKDTAVLRGWTASLPEAEFALRGHLVADLAVTESRVDDGYRRIGIEVLTVEDR